MTNDDKTLQKTKSAAETRKPLNKFMANIKTLQWDLETKGGLLFNKNQLVVQSSIENLIFGFSSQGAW